MKQTIFILLTLSSLALAQKPDWVRNYGKSSTYPDQLYLLGFGMSKVSGENDRSQSLQRAVETAKGNLIQSIRVKLQSSVGSVTEERNQKVSSYFTSATQSTSSLEIQGLDVKSYYDDNEEMSYALAYVSRERLATTYQEKEKQLRIGIAQKMNAGKAAEERAMKTLALEEYLSCYLLFRQLEETRAILFSSKSAAASVFEELEGVVTKDDIDISVVRNAVDKMLQRPLEHVEDVAWHLVYCLKEQADIKDATVLVTPMTYGDTRMGSPFSRFFKVVLENKLNEVAKWTPVQQVAISQTSARDMTREAAEASGAKYVVRGTYWEQQGVIKFIVSLLRVSDSRLIGGAETVVRDSIVQKAGLDLKPQNFQAALGDQKQFDAGEVLGGGLSLEVWTNKGTDDLVFTKGERMQAYVRVNLPSYIRFIYHLADGKRALLLDNYYVDQSKVNMVYQIPEEFECDEPYGAEFLQAFARTEPFEPIATEEIGGYNILKDDLKGFLTMQRGMKKVKQGTLQAETRLVMTTMEK